MPITPTQFDALKGEGSNEPLLGEGGEFILPEGFGANRQWPLPLFASGDWTVPTPCGLPEFVSPVPAFTNGFIFTQKFMQYLANWSPGVMNQPHPSANLFPDYSQWFLVAEGKRRDMQHGVVEWERTYSLVPFTHDEFETYGYTFIGYSGFQTISVGGVPVASGSTIGPPFLADGVTPNPDAGKLTGTIFTPVVGGGSWYAGRPRFTPPGGVTSRVRHEYFKVAGADAWSAATVYLTGNMVRYSGSTYVCISPVGPVATTPDVDTAHWQFISSYNYATAGDIPTNTGQLYLNTYLASAILGLYTDYLGDTLGAFTATTPSRTEYSGWISNARSLGWNSGIAPGGANPGQIIAEDSRVSRWQGNIWLRQTRYILAA